MHTNEDSMELFIGNLGHNITAGDLKALFSTYGTVTSVTVPTDDYDTPRGYAYVEMCNDVQAVAAMRALNKKNFMGQFISVSEAINSTSCTQVKQAHYAYQNMMVAG